MARPDRRTVEPAGWAVRESDREEAMKYLMLVCVDGPFEADPAELNVQPWLDEMHARGIPVCRPPTPPPSAYEAAKPC